MESKENIILFGTGRSGTTIFMEALFRHPDLAYFSTLLEKKPDCLKINYLRYIFDNRFYRLFGQKKQLNRTNFLNRIIFKPSEAYPIWQFLLGHEVDFRQDFLYKKNPSVDTKKKVLEYVDKLCLIQGKKRFALKITGPGRLDYLYTLFPSAHFVWLKRDFIPTLSSFLKVDFWQDRSTGQPWWKGPYTEDEMKKLDLVKSDPVLFTAIQLDKIIRVIEEEIDQLSLRVHTVDYENFVQQPETELLKTLDFCNLTEDIACFNYLNSNNIINRNLRHTDYFKIDTLVKMEELLERKLVKY